MSDNTSSKWVTASMVGFGSLVFLWVAATFVGALHQVNWQFSELARQYMLATGMMKPLHSCLPSQADPIVTDVTVQFTRADREGLAAARMFIS